MGTWKEVVVLKIKSGYILRDVADAFIVVPVGERVIDFKGLMTLNETGAFIWRKMEAEVSFENLLNFIVDEYDIDIEQASLDLNEFIDKVRGIGAIEK